MHREISTVQFRSVEVITEVHEPKNSQSIVAIVLNGANDHSNYVWRNILSLRLQIA